MHSRARLFPLRLSQRFQFVCKRPNFQPQDLTCPGTGWKAYATRCLEPVVTRVLRKLGEGAFHLLGLLTRWAAAWDTSLIIRADNLAMARLIPRANPWGVFSGSGSRIW